MTDTVEKKAYAKINLSLDVVGKRPDGFHLLDSVMQSVSLFDLVTLRAVPGGEIRLSTDKSYLPVDGRNTAVKAARLFFAHTGIASGLDMAIEKRIPGRAGLGGGSADAAAVLLGLDELFDAQLSQETLLQLSGQVGSDVPFCLLGGTRRCRGTGEQMEPAPPLPDCAILLCKPAAGVSTPRAYALLDEAPGSSKPGTPALLAALESGNLREIGRAVSNRFRQVIRLMPVTNIRKTMLSCGALGAEMSGSGSCVYGLFPDETSARRCGEIFGGSEEVFVAGPIRS